MEDAWQVPIHSYQCRVEDEAVGGATEGGFRAGNAGARYKKSLHRSLDPTTDQTKYKAQDGLGRQHMVG